MSNDELKQKVIYAKSKLPLVSYREIAQVMGCSEQNIYVTYLDRINENKCKKLLNAIEKIRIQRGEK